MIVDEITHEDGCRFIDENVHGCPSIAADSCILELDALDGSVAGVFVDVKVDLHSARVGVHYDRVIHGHGLDCMGKDVNVEKTKMRRVN